MKSIVKLDSGIFSDGARRQALSNFPLRSAREFKNLTKRRMAQATRTGRLYSRTRGAGFTRAHRASARGERPAIDSGKLLNSIDSRRTGEFSAETFVGAEHAAILASDRFNRPSITESDRNEAQAKYLRDGVAVVNSLI